MMPDPTTVASSRPVPSLRTSFLASPGAVSVVIDFSSSFETRAQARRDAEARRRAFGRADGFEACIEHVDLPAC